VEDNLPAINYNPACFQASGESNGNSLLFFLNPVPPLYIYSSPEDFSLENKSGFYKAVKSVSLFIKGITFNYKSLNGGFLFSEELIPYDDFSNDEEEKIFNSRNFLRNHYHSFVLNLRFSQSISFGVTTYLFYKEEGDEQIYTNALSYGLLLRRSDKYKIGLAYMDIPAQFGNARRRFDRIADETISAGFSYYFTNSTVMSIDLRNLNEDDIKSFGLRELHFGIEKSLFGHLSLRSGYFRVAEKDNENRSDVFSLGLSLLNMNMFTPETDENVLEKPLLSYSFLLEKGEFRKFYWHFLTISLCI